jgi:protein-L-isoaspartate(D-aspartate) O-methyltransferase
MSDRLLFERTRMIENQMLRRGLRDPRVLASIMTVPRHLFVPVSRRASAYEDCPLPIGFGQTISQPYIVALMTSSLELQGEERVLEVGTGSGYQAAILAQLAREVHTIECLPELSARARRVALRLHLHNIAFHTGDGSQGWAEAAPYDAIMVTAAAPALPAPLVGQLVEGGRLVIPLSDSHGYQLLKLLRTEGGQISERVLSSVAFVPLRGRYGIRP